MRMVFLRSITRSETHAWFCCVWTRSPAPKLRFSPMIGERCTPHSLDSWVLCQMFCQCDAWRTVSHSNSTCFSFTNNAEIFVLLSLELYSIMETFLCLLWFSFCLDFRAFLNLRVTFWQFWNHFRDGIIEFAFSLFVFFLPRKNDWGRGFLIFFTVVWVLFSTF